MKKFMFNLVYLLLGMPVGVVYFTILVTGFALGFSLSFTLVGVPILFGMIFITYLMADFERSVTARLLGIGIAKPEARPARSESTAAILAVQLRDWNFWRQFVYLILKLPLGIITFTLAVALTSISLALLAAPAIVTFFPGTDYMVAPTFRVDTMPEALITLAGGVVASALTVLIINAASLVLGKFTRWALGAPAAEA